MLDRLDVEKQSMPVQADARNLPFADEAVDEFVLTNVFGDRGLSHPEYYGEILQEIVRVLKKNGKIYITETYTPGFVPEFMKVSKNQDGLPSVDKLFFKRIGLVVKSVSFAQKDVGQYDKYTSEIEMFGNNFLITLVKE